MSDFGGGEGSFDQCECVASQSGGAMARLLNMLRNSQNTCNDRECMDDAGTPDQLNMLMMLLLWLLFAAAMYYMRPASMRPAPVMKRTGPSPDSDQSRQPPAPTA
eukprot:m.136877 g.136877  ORF g.136877 m.136877 type:complete len:105 (-) comp52482_c0_seq3:91-405(-)